MGWHDLQEVNADHKDVVIGIAASGTTPYVVGALEACQQHNIVTSCITCNPDSPLAAAADYPLEVIVCPECLKRDSNNTTKGLSRKRLRKAPKIKGFPVHKNAFCVYCGNRMVVMPADEHYRRLMEQHEDQIKGML